MRPPPFIAAYGLGVDSTPMIIGLHRRRVRPDAILFADVGSVLGRDRRRHSRMEAP